ncbi:hypothetical protein F8A90_14000 [Cobetia sp. cqz5-12]|nr:hypothetical protein F8A90_14000 [Cobetia sp. cqz5-12]
MTDAVCVCIHRPVGRQADKAGSADSAVCGVRCAVCGVRCAVCGVRCAVCGARDDATADSRA